MQKITIDLPYDFDIGDYSAEAINALCELTRLVGDHVTDVPRLTIATSIVHVEGCVSYTILTEQLDSEIAPFDWLVDATDTVMPTEADDAAITLQFSLEDDQALLLKAAWPSALPRLNVESS